MQVPGKIYLENRPERFDATSVLESATLKRAESPQQKLIAIHHLLISEPARHMQERTKYQQKIIKNYYNNQDAIMLQRLGDLVSNLYLSEGKTRARHWKNAISALEKMKVPQSRIDHIVSQDDPKLLASLVEELLAKQ